MIFRDAAEPPESQTQARFVTTSYSPARPLLEFSSAIFWNLPRLAVRVRRTTNMHQRQQESRTSRRELASVTASSPQRPGLYGWARSRLRALDGNHCFHRQRPGQGWDPGLRPLRTVGHVTVAAGMQPAVLTIFGGRFLLSFVDSCLIVVGISPPSPVPLASPRSRFLLPVPNCDPQTAGLRSVHIQRCDLNHQRIQQEAARKLCWSHR